MARAISARVKGDDFQARWCWIQICRLFEERSKVVRVEYEAANVKSFDDVVVYFNGQYYFKGNSLFTEFYQLKFHVTDEGSLTWQNLMDPAFINAARVSILQRLRDAQRQFAPNGTEAHFIFLTSWQVHPDDGLAQVISKTDGSIDWHRLNAGGPRSAKGRIRTQLRQHLEIETDEELSLILQPFRICLAPTLQKLEQELNLHLRLAGLRPVPEGCMVHPYDDLTRKLLQVQKTNFTRTSVEEICRQEDLWVGTMIAEPEVHRIGIRSFLRWAENLVDATDAMLDLLPWFEGRNIRFPEQWQTEIYPQVTSFLQETLQAHQHCHLHLHTHSSIAFAAGYCLDPKSGIDVAVVQSTSAGRVLWRPDPQPKQDQYPAWVVNDIPIQERAEDVALALSVTHEVLPDVTTYLNRAQLPIHQIIHCSLPEGANSRAVVNGNHAWLLAQQLVIQVRSSRIPIERRGRLHLFIAAPNGFVFFLGQLARGFGPCQLYEYDFDTGAPGAYQPSLIFPPLPSISNK